VLSKYDVQWIVFPTDSILVRQLAGQPEWQTVYQDDLATVLLRRDAAAEGMRGVRG
jgi:hypothetical protein